MFIGAHFTGPRNYDDCLGPLWFDPFARELASRLPQRPPGDVLEIACGTGLVTLRLRERLARPLRLVASDVSRPMLDFARAKLAEVGGIEWREADAMKLPFEDEAFAAVVCGFGMMFMPDRHAAFGEARRVLPRGAILLFSVWDRLESNPHAHAAARVMQELFPADPVSASYSMTYDMGDGELLRRLLRGARFDAACIETKRIAIAAADPERIATGLVRGTPRAAMIEARGVSLDVVVGKIAQALTATGGNPYHGQAQAVLVQAVAV